MTRTNELECGVSGGNRRLIGIAEIMSDLVHVSRRSWLRLCEQGLAPWGVKLGGRRLWDREEVERWIAAGCPRVAEKTQLRGETHHV